MNAAVRWAAHAERLVFMSELEYGVVGEYLYHTEFGEYYTYGIQVRSPGYTEVLHDVSVNHETVEHIVGLLNHCKVSPIHLFDVIMDMLP